MKQLFQAILANIGYKLVPLRHPTRQAFEDQKALVRGKSVMIFDVGAHHGETSLLYNNLFKEPLIYAFEPFIASFEQLKNNTSGINNIKIFNIAIGNTSGEVDFHVNSSAPTNSILATHPQSHINWGPGLLNTLETTRINSLTLDDFIEQNKIGKINILKLDTQGAEYSIIEGALNSIAQNKISLIYLEIIIMPTYVGQKYLDEILFLLRQTGFVLYNFYNYQFTASGELLQVDAIFRYNGAEQLR